MDGGVDDDRGSDSNEDEFTSIADILHARAPKTLTSAVKFQDTELLLPDFLQPVKDGSESTMQTAALITKRVDKLRENPLFDFIEQVTVTFNPKAHSIVKFGVAETDPAAEAMDGIFSSTKWYEDILKRMAIGPEYTGEIKMPVVIQTNAHLSIIAVMDIGGLTGAPTHNINTCITAIIKNDIARARFAELVATRMRLGSVVHGHSVTFVQTETSRKDHLDRLTRNFRDRFVYNKCTNSVQLRSRKRLALKKRSRYAFTRGAGSE